MKVNQPIITFLNEAILNPLHVVDTKLNEVVNIVEKRLNEINNKIEKLE